MTVATRWLPQSPLICDRSDVDEIEQILRSVLTEALDQTQGPTGPGAP